MTYFILEVDVCVQWPLAELDHYAEMRVLHEFRVPDVEDGKRLAAMLVKSNSPRVTIRPLTIIQFTNGNPQEVFSFEPTT